MKLQELIAKQFYAWEKRGRGWQVWDHPVEIEPPFVPFQGYYIPSQDDGRRHTFLSALVERKKDKLALPEHQLEMSDIEAFYEQETPALYTCDSELTELQVSLPSKNDYKPESFERFLQSLRAARYPIAFEVIGLAQSITLQFTCRAEDLSLLRSSLRAYFPNSVFIEASEYLINSWLECPDDEPLIIDFGLSHEFVIPLQIDTNSSIDAFTGIIAALDEVRDEEIAVVQAMFQPVQYEWAQSIIDATTGGTDQSVFANAPDMHGHMKRKIASTLFACVVRIGIKSGSQERTLELMRRLGLSLTSSFSDGSAPFGEANELIPLTNDSYDPYKHEEGLIRRETHRSGMLINCSELGGIVRLPSPSVKSHKFANDSETTKAAPAMGVYKGEGNGLADTNRYQTSHRASNHHPIFLGENTHQGETKTVCLSNQQRSRHLYAIGASGSGKSTLIANLIKQDMEQGNGLCLLDPHGDLVDEVIANVPDHRLSDVILFDPSDAEFPIGFNILQANSELEKTLLSSDLTATFRRMSTSWGDVLDTVLANAVLAFVESTRGGSLFDLKRFLVEKEFREEFLETVEDIPVRYFWTEEFSRLIGRPENGIIVRLDAFTRQKLIRNIVCQKESKLNLREVMDKRKILLVKLSQGAIGLENSFLLGTMLVSKINQIALSRQDSGDRPHFWLYLDEFHNFVTPTIEMLLSGARKYNVGLVLAHQEFNQLQSRSSEVASSVMANCYTRICFRLGDNDASKFSNGFSFFNAEQLQNLGVGEAIARIERAEYDFNLKTPYLPKVVPAIASQKRDVIVANTRSLYARSKAEVAETIQIKTNPIKSDTPNVLSKTPVLPDPSAITGTPSLFLSQPDQSMDARTSTERRITHQPESNKPKKEYQPRGGQHHKDFQEVIKRVAENYGFEVAIEEQLLDGSKVDVSLQKGSLRIACEVSITSSADYETRSVLKCLAAGYDYVAVIVSNQKKAPALNLKLHSEITPDQLSKVKVFGLTGLLEFLRDLTPNESSTPKTKKSAGQRLTFTEACEFFGVNSSTLYRWIRAGRIPFYRPGREYQFDRNELALIGRQDLSGKRKASVDLAPLKIEKALPKGKKSQNLRYRKLLNLD